MEWQRPVATLVIGLNHSHTTYETFFFSSPCKFLAGGLEEIKLTLVIPIGQTGLCVKC